jgi:hypothetical protein
MIKRESISKNRTLGNKLDGNKAHLYQVMGERYNPRNAYDKFSLLNNRIPSKQYYISAVPDYITLTYNCIIFTDFVEQNNKLVEAVEFASDSYWGDPSRFKFRANIDTFTTTTLLEQGTDRAARTSFTINLNGYILPDTVNKDLAVASSKFFTKSQVIFTFETAESADVFTTSGASKGPKSPMGSATPIDSYNVQVTNITVAGNDAILIYLGANSELNGTFVDNVTFTFNKGWLSAPSPLPATSIENFVFFCNGQNIEKSAIVSFTENSGVSTLVINPTLLTYSFENTDLVTAIGKFTI